MTASEMVARLKQLLGRPDSDTFYTDPDEYYAALNEAVRQVRVRLAMQYPALLWEESSAVASSDTGETYAIPSSGEVIGQLRVFEPPGIRTGMELLPAMPGMGRQGFRILGTNIKLTVPKNYSPGLYFLYIPTSFTEIDGSNDSPLPNFLDDYLVYRAASIMARKAGSGADTNAMEMYALNLWRGNPNDMYDTGIIGVLSHYTDREGMAGLDYADDRWWGRLP